MSTDGGEFTRNNTGASFTFISKPPCYISRCSGCPFYSSCLNADKENIYYPTIVYQTTGTYQVGADPAVGATPCTRCGNR